MPTLDEFFRNIVGEVKPLDELPPVPQKDYCRYHLIDKIDGVCPQCAEDKERGYQVLMLTGRAANGSQRDSGTLWHAVREKELKAVCGATYGRRSAGWSSYMKLHQPVTCPRCLKRLHPRTR